MDNEKMGNIIREARKKKGLTQKDIATHLNITDRAVSKWERGICAPDLALLEPLADILDISITELITGEVELSTDNKATVDFAVKETIQYSKKEKSKTKKKIIMFVLIGIFIILLILGTMWYQGYFHIIGKYPSPDGSITTIYNCELGDSGPKTGNAITFKNDDGETVFRNSEFIGLWWSPDNNYKILSLYNTKYKENQLILSDLKRGIATDLIFRLEEAISHKNFFSQVTSDTDVQISFEFIQWSDIDPAVMLIYFKYTDSHDVFHEGYMWYDYESGEASGEMEINQSKKEIYFLNEFWDDAD